MTSESEEELELDVQNHLLAQLDRYAKQFLGDEASHNKMTEIRQKKKTKQPKRMNKQDYLSEDVQDEKTQTMGDLNASDIQDEMLVKCPNSDEDVETVMIKQNPASEDQIMKCDDEVNVALKISKKSKRGKKLDKKPDSDLNEDKRYAMHPKKKKTKKTKGSNMVAKKVSKDNPSVGFENDSDLEYGDGDLLSEGDEDFDDQEDFSDMSDINYESDEGFETTQSNSKTTIHGHLEDLKQKLGLTEKDFLEYKKDKEKKDQASVKLSHPLQSGQANKKRPPPEVIIFEDPAKRKKNAKRIPRGKASTRNVDFKSKSQGIGFDMISAKHEVHKFGIDGFDQKSKDEAKVDLLVQLGAKRPKNEYLNYKKYMDKQKQQKLQQQEQASVIDKHYLGSVNPNDNKKKKRKGKTKGSEFGDGQIGSYKHGVQVVDKTDINRINAIKSGKR